MAPGTRHHPSLDAILALAARQHGPGTRAQLLDAAPRSSHRHARLKRALDRYVPGTAGTEGEPEAAFLELCAAHGLPIPHTQVPIGRYRADFVWRDLNLVVEIDDRGSHDGYIA